jgi:hypothetical protein
MQRSEAKSMLREYREILRGVMRRLRMVVDPRGTQHHIDGMRQRAAKILRDAEALENEMKREQSNEPELRLRVVQCGLFVRKYQTILRSRTYKECSIADVSVLVNQALVSAVRKLKGD